jgi:probable HAF family extracellular repeat protein
MFLWVLAASAADYEVVELGTLGGRSTAAAAINERGQVAGVSSLAGPEQHAFVWENGKMRDLGTLGGRHSFAWDINERGQVVGGAQDDQGRTRAVIWSGTGPAQDLGVLEGGEASFAIAVNERGQVAGFSQTLDGETHAVLWDAGKAIDLGTLGGGFSYAIDVNERGEVLAMSTTPTGHRAFVWRDGQRTEVGPAEATWSSAFDLNDKGQVVGSAPLGDEARLVGYRWSPGGPTDTFGLGGDIVIVSAINEAGDAAGYGTLTAARPGVIEAGLRPDQAPDFEATLAAFGEQESAPEVEVHAFVYRAGVLTDLGTLGGAHASAVDINDSGHVIGSSARAIDGRPRAFVWRDGTMTELPTPEEASAGASDINNRGQIVGSWSYEGRRRAFVASPCTPGTPDCGGDSRRSEPGTR